MLKLLVITNALERGGAEKLLVNTLPLLKSEKIHIELLLLNAKLSEPSYLDAMTANGIVIHNAEMSNIYNPLSIFKIRNILKSNKFDVVHVHLFPSLYWAAASTLFLKKKPVLIFTEHSNENKRRKNRILNIVERLVYKRFNKIIAISESVKTNLKNWVDLDDKIEVILNGVNVSAIDNTTEIDKNLLCKDLAIKPDSILLFMAASLKYPKDQKTVIQALEKLGGKYQLIFAGEGHMKHELENLAASLGLKDRVHFIGFRKDVQAIMKSVDINILSSEYEGMSGVTLESLAAGRPFLGSAVNGIEEFVPNNDFLFRCGDFNELAVKISAIIDNDTLSNRMSWEGIKHVKQYDVQRMLSKYANLYFTTTNKQHTDI